MTDDLPEGARTFASAGDWSAWLDANHLTSRGVWLAMPTKGTPATSVTRREAVEIALCYGWIDGQAASSCMPDGWWAQRFTPRRPGSRWSKINCAIAERLIAGGRMRPAGLDQIARAKADGRWDAAYDPPSTAKIPPDLRAALDARPAACAAFTALDARDRYRILLDLQNARRPETRARRMARFLDRITAGLPPRPGPGDTTTAAPQGTRQQHTTREGENPS